MQRLLKTWLLALLMGTIYTLSLKTTLEEQAEGIRMQSRTDIASLMDQFPPRPMSISEI